jgi:hypothetical protein
MRLKGTASVHKFCFISDRSATEAREMLKLAYQEETARRTGAHMKVE